MFLTFFSSTPVGSVYFFRTLNNGVSWIEEQKLVPMDGSTSDLFGQSVSVFGDVLAVGAPWKGSNTGMLLFSYRVFKVYVY